MFLTSCYRVMQKETEVTPWLKIFVLPGCSRLTNRTIAKRKEQPLRVVLMIYFMQHLCSKVSLSAGESVTTRTALTMKSSSSVCVWQVHKQKKTSWSWQQTAKQNSERQGTSWQWSSVCSTRFKASCFCKEMQTLSSTCFFCLFGLHKNSQAGTEKHSGTNLQQNSL